MWKKYSRIFLSKLTNEVDNFDVDHLISEIRHCQEGERHSANSMFNMILALITAIGLIGASFAILDNRPTPRIFIWIVSGIISIGLTYISNIGLTNGLRYHYVRALEERLRELTGDNIFYSWQEIHSTLMTLDVKRIRSRYPVLHFSNLIVTIFSALFICACFILLFGGGVEAFLENIFYCLLILSPSLILTICSWISGTSKSSNLYKYAKERAEEKRAECIQKCKDGERIKEQSEEEKIKKSQKNADNTKEKINYLKSISYFLYTRPPEIIKGFFVLLGFAIGTYYNYAINNVVWYDSIWQTFSQFGVVFIIVEVLTYQVRYQWNDIRGYVEDKNHVEGKSRKRLGNLGIPFTTAIRISFVVMIFKISLALFLVMKSDSQMQSPLFIGIFSILLLAIIYEFARENKKVKATIILVCFGYPLRFFIALWAAFPQLFGQIQYSHNGLYLWSLLFILSATWAFGGVFVTLAWAQEGIYMSNKIGHKAVKKVHLRHLAFQSSKKIRDYDHVFKKYPLEERGELPTWWNFFYVIMSTSLCLAIYFALTNSSFSYILIISLITSTSCIFFSKKGRWIAFILNVISSIALWILVYLPLSHWFGLDTLISLIMVGYIYIYISFRNTNYIEMTYATVVMKKKIIEFMIGKETVAQLKNEKNNSTK